MNLFSLHGKWYQDDENRLTSNVLFFLDRFSPVLLPPFLRLFASDDAAISCDDISSHRIRFQVYDAGRIPDAEIVLDDRIRILLEAKIGSNLIHFDQLAEYCDRLQATAERFPEYYLFVLTQTDQNRRIAGMAEELERAGRIDARRVRSVKWEKVLEVFDHYKASGSSLRMLMHMFLEEVQSTMYSRTDIDSLPVGELNEVVLTTQNAQFAEMAIEDCVFWPYARFRPAQYVAYYFTRDCPDYVLSIPYVARIEHIWYDATIDEVLTAIPQFKNLPDFQRFRERALQIYPSGSETQFTIAITDTPVRLQNRVHYESRTDTKLHPRILPGQTTTFAQLMNATTLDDLR